MRVLNNKYTACYKRNNVSGESFGYDNVVSIKF